MNELHVNDDPIEHARQCAVTLLREIAAKLEAAPPQLAADALLRLAEPLVALEEKGAGILALDGTSG